MTRICVAVWDMLIALKNQLSPTSTKACQPSCLDAILIWIANKGLWEGGFILRRGVVQFLLGPFFP